MDLVVSVESHFQVTPDGRAWSQVEFDYLFWCRYLEVFDCVTVLARAKPVSQAPDGWREVTGDRVRMHCIPDYTGPVQYLSRWRPIQHAIQTAFGRPTAVIMRVPSQIANCAANLLSGQPFGLEVVTDPADMFTYETIHRRLAPAYRWWFTHNLRKQCLRAIGVAYVTRYALQCRYPSQALSLGFSDVHLPEGAISSCPKVYATSFSSIQMDDRHLVTAPRTKVTPVVRLITVGSLARPYKGTHVLIDAVAACREAGLRLQLTIVGDGACRPSLEKQAGRLGLSNQIRFAGQLPSGDAVRCLLDQSDLFVLPSRSEGLPRAMLEAMARGLPCVGSDVGGIPELLAPEDLVPASNVEALAGKIQEIVHNPTRLMAMSARNLQTAGEYRSIVLAERRRTFYRHIRVETETWLQQAAEPIPGPKNTTREETTALRNYAR